MMKKTTILLLALLLSLTACIGPWSITRIFETGSGPYTEYSVDFCGDAKNVTGGTMVASLCLLNATSNSSTIWIPYSRTCTNCNITAWFNTGNLSSDNAKFYYADAVNGTLANERYFLQAINASHNRLSPEPGYDYETGPIPVDTWNKLTIVLNDTSGYSMLYVYNSTGSLYGVYSGSRINKSYTTSGKYLAIYTGSFHDHFWITNISITDTTGSGSSATGRVDISGGVNFSLNSPLNATSVNATSVNISAYVYNMNVSSSGGSANTTPVVCTFANTSDACGFDLAPSNGVLNISTTTQAVVNASNYSWMNVSMYIYCPNNATGLKYRPSRDTGADAWLWECNDTDCTVKNEDSYSLSLTGFPINAWVKTWITSNRTLNVSTIDWTGKGGASTGTSFDIIANSTDIQFESPYSGGDCAIDNMTITVLSSEAPNSSGTPGNSTLNVSFYWSNNTLFKQVNGTANASLVSVNVSVSNGTYTWYATISTERNSLNVTGMTFNITTPTSPGNRTVTSVTPTVNVNVTRFADENYTVTLSCSSDYCGAITAYLDPITPVFSTNGTSYNSKTHQENYNDILKAATNNYGTGSGFNTTQTFTGGTCGAGKTCLWVPWYTSGSACGISQLHTYGSCSSGMNMTYNTMVTDEFSEVGLALSGGNASAEQLFVYWTNTVDAMGTMMNLYGDLPTWALCRNGNTLTDVGGEDSASDATHRIVLALYIAGNNSAFTADNRTRFLNTASKLMNQSIQYETSGGSTSYSTDHYGTTTWLLFGGGDAVGVGATRDIDMYGGYYQDAIAACLAHAKHHPENTTLPAICGNWTQQFLVQTKYAGGTSPSNVRVGHFRIWWNVTSGTLRSGPPYGQEPSYDLTSTTGMTGDDADMPRLYGICRTIRYANETGFYNLSSGPFRNLSDWCTAFSRNSGLIATSSNAAVCQQWKTSDSSQCQTGKGPFDDVMRVGMLAPSFTWFNQSQFIYVMDELMRHYSWSSNTFDSTSCGNGLTYSGVRITKAFLYGMDLDIGVFGGSSTGGGGGETGPTEYNKNGSLVSTTVGDSPVYTTSSNPLTSADYACLGNLSNASNCTITWRLNYTGSAGTVMEFWVYTTTTADGSVVNGSKYNITIVDADTTAPSVTVTAVTTGNSSVNITYNASEDVNHSISINGTLFANTTFAQNRTAILTGLLPYRFYVYNLTTWDAFGNSNRTNGSFTTADGAAPAVYLSSPANGTTYNTSTIQFLWNASDNAATTLSCAVYTNRSGWTAASNASYTTGVTTGINISGFSNGAYRWNVQCNDTSGLSSFNNTNRTFIVNISSPQVELCSGVPRLVFIPNRTNYNVSTLRTTQSVLANGTTVCTIVVNSTGQTSNYSLVGFINYSNGSYGISIGGLNLSNQSDPLADSSGNGRTLYGYVGAGIYFRNGSLVGTANGMNYYRVPIDASSFKEFSFVVKLYPKPTTNKYNYSDFVGSSFNPRLDFFRSSATNYTHFRFGANVRNNSPNGADRSTGSDNLPFGYNYTVVLTYNQTTQNLSLYIDGILNRTITVYGGWNVTPYLNNFTVGGRIGDTDYLNFNGSLYYVKIYNRSLSSAEVTGLYSDPDLYTDKLIAYYKFDTNTYITDVNTDSVYRYNITGYWNDASINRFPVKLTLRVE